ncbi:MAG: glutamate racemase [Acidobacteriota bacterium]
MTSEAPIGVFDSGVGGLTVVAELRRRLPAEDIVYLGDTARLPYGSKSPEVVARYTQRNVEVLAERGVKAVIVACNSASAMGLETLDAKVPVWGVIEPGAEAAVRTGARCVGVLATESTVRSGAYSRAIARRDPQIEVVLQPCPLLVPLVEEGWTDDPVTLEIVRRYLKPVLRPPSEGPEKPAGVPEALVLGCTHYPLLSAAIARAAAELGAVPQLVDSASSVTDTVELGLRDLGLARAEERSGDLRLLVTDPGPRIRRIAEEILGTAPELEWVDLQL